MRVEKLTKTDVPAFMLVAERFFYESYHKHDTLELDKFERHIMAALDHQNVAIFVAKDGPTAACSIIVGYIIINYSNEFKAEREGNMFELYVLPRYRGTPAGRLLAKAAVEQFDAWGCVDSHLCAAPGLGDTEADHAKALALFKNMWFKYGYRQTGIILTRSKARGVAPNAFVSSEGE